MYIIFAQNVVKNNYNMNEDKIKIGNELNHKFELSSRELKVRIN
jgi:hypothetical protein